MKNIALCIALLLSGLRTFAGEMSRDLANCRELVAALRPTLSEDEGKKYLEDADRAYRDCRGEKFPVDIRVDALFKYGMATAGRDRSQTAIAALREAIELLDGANGNRSQRLIEILDRVAIEESRSNLQTDAVAHAKRAADVRVKVHGADSAQAAEGMVHLAMVYVTFKDFSKTESLLREAIRIATEACGPECDTLVDAYSGMAVLSDARGNASDARKYEELAMNAVPSSRPSATKH